MVRPRFLRRYAGLLLLAFGFRLQLVWLRYRTFLIIAMIAGALAAVVIFLGPQVIAAWVKLLAWLKSLVPALPPPTSPTASP